MRRLLLSLAALSFALPFAACGPTDDGCEGAECPGADGGGGSDGGGGGTDGGGGGTCETDPDFVPGDPITAADLTWTWVDIPESRCMNGSTTGIGVSTNPASDRLFIYLQGGGACFDTFTCRTVANQDGFDETKFDSAAQFGLTQGIFDRDDPNNPIADWNFVFIPYCSGDVHSGLEPAGMGGRQFLGHSNTAAFLSRIVPTFPEVSMVLLSGSSAGGFGSSLNFVQTQGAFGCTTVHLLNDAGPALPDAYLKPCLQQTFRDTWNLNSTLPADCTDCFGADGGGLAEYYPFLADTYPESRFGVLSNVADGTIRTFFGYGYSRDCATPMQMPAADFEAGLIEVRDVLLAGRSNAAFFLVPGTGHTFLGQSPAGVAAGGTTLSLWIERLVDGDPAWVSVGP